MLFGHQVYFAGSDVVYAGAELVGLYPDANSRPGWQGAGDCVLGDLPAIKQCKQSFFGLSRLCLRYSWSLPSLCLLKNQSDQLWSTELSQYYVLAAVSRMRTHSLRVPVPTQSEGRVFADPLALRQLGHVIYLCRRLTQVYAEMDEHSGQQW